MAAEHRTYELPSAASVQFTNSWVATRILEIERGELGTARIALQRQSWRQQFDCTGVAPELIDQIGRCCVIAVDALQGPLVDTETAVKALARMRATLCR